VYTSSILRGAPYAFYKISFTYKKKKEKKDARSVGVRTQMQFHRNHVLHEFYSHLSWKA
jgi:menaquinone-dependent protoporphyrinogen IX oxidase